MFFQLKFKALFSIFQNTSLDTHRVMRVCDSVWYTCHCRKVIDREFWFLTIFLSFLIALKRGMFVFEAQCIGRRRLAASIRASGGYTVEQGPSFNGVTSVQQGRLFQYNVLDGSGQRVSSAIAGKCPADGQQLPKYGTQHIVA